MITVRLSVVVVVVTMLLPSTVTVTTGSKAFGFGLIVGWGMALLACTLYDREDKKSRARERASSEESS